MARVRASLYDYKQGETTEAQREGHERTFGNQGKAWCPHCDKVIKREEPTCQWCGKEIESGSDK